MSVQSDSGEGYDEFCHATVHTTGRQEDYLMIPQSILAKNMAYQPTYYCGTNDNLLVYGECLVLRKGNVRWNSAWYVASLFAASPPYMMHFSSDDLTLNRDVETGFSMTYRQRNSLL